MGSCFGLAAGDVLTGDRSLFFQNVVRCAVDLICIFLFVYISKRGICMRNYTKAGMCSILTSLMLLAAGCLPAGLSADAARLEGGC